MILHRGLIFNRFGDEEEKSVGSTAATTTLQLKDYVQETQLDVRLIQLQDDFNNGAKQIFTKMEDYVKKTDDLVKAIKVDKNYISVGNKRIVSATKAINKNDVVIKSQLESTILTSINLTNTVIKNHVVEYEKLKNTVNQHIQKFENYHMHMSRELQEILEKQKLHDDKITVLESKP